jgi:hypothetical protein
MKMEFVLSVVGLAVAGGAPLARAAGRDATVLMLDGSSYATNIDLDQMLRVQKGRSGDFLWFRRGGQAYLVTDSGVLAAARDILGPVRALNREQEALRQRQRPFEEREEALDREEEALEDREERLEGRDDRAAEEERDRLDVLQRAVDQKQRALEVEMGPFEAEERRLDDRERAVEAVADAAIARLVEDALRKGLAQRVR